MSDFNPKTAIYTPAQVTTYATERIRYIEQNAHRALHFFVPGIDQYFAPLLPGQVCSIIAQTSNYKSGFMHAWEFATATQLKNEGRDEIIIHVSVEESVEEQAYLLLGQLAGEDAGELARGNVQDWSKLGQAAITVGTIPIFRIGDSLARAEDFPELYLSNMVKAIETLVSGQVTGHKYKPAAIFFDYLQAFPFDPEVRRADNKDMQRRLQVREDIYRLRQAAAHFDCPIIVGVQAKQHLNDARKDFQMPGIYDGEESSAIAQRCDRIIQLWLPKMTHAVGTFIDYGGRDVQVAENMLFIKVGKQRGRLPAGKTYQCEIDYQRNKIRQVGL